MIKKPTSTLLATPLLSKKYEKRGIAYEQTEVPASVVQDSVSNMSFHQALIQTF